MRSLNWEPEEYTPPPQVAPVGTQILSPPITVAPPPVTVVTPAPSNPDRVAVVQERSRITRNRVGNGHKKQFVRKLYDSERDMLRQQFMVRDGRIEEDDCVRLKQTMNAEVAIFQVTGFISYLHRDVAIGRIVLRNLDAYIEWMHTKYEGLWQQYNRPKFVAIRLQNNLNRRAGQPLVGVPLEEVPITPQFQTTTPKFSAFNSFRRRGGR